ncbi:MAG: hypothetical protein ACLPKB_33140 [Xanthobacteraceae bacterium]
MQFTSSSTVQKNSHPAILAATASVALLALLAATLLASSAVRSHGTSPAMAAARMNAIVAAPATMDIVPADVMDHSAERFVGTGDGSAGSWVP